MSINAGTGHDSQCTQGVPQQSQQSVSEVVQGYDDRGRNGGDGFTDRAPLPETSPCSNTVPANESNEGLGAESNVVSKRPRIRLDLTQKLEITKLVKKKIKYGEIARRYGCALRTIKRIAGSSAQLEARMESPRFGKRKSVYPGQFPEVEKRVLEMIRDARRLRVPVTGDVISSFGRTVKKQMLESPEGISEVGRKRLEGFIASAKWKDNLVKRNGLVSISLRDEADGFDDEAAREAHQETKQEKLNERSKKRKGCADHTDGMGDPIDNPEETADRQSLEDTINGASSTMQEASEDTRAGFPDSRDKLNDLGVETGASAPTGAVDAAVDCPNLEEGQDVSDAIGEDLEHIHSTAGHSTGDKESGAGEENETDCSSPEELELCLDRLDKFARVTDNPRVSHHVQEIREAIAQHTFAVGKEPETGTGIYVGKEPEIDKGTAS